MIYIYYTLWYLIPHYTVCLFVCLYFYWTHLSKTLEICCCRCLCTEDLTFPLNVGNRFPTHVTKSLHRWTKSHFMSAPVKVTHQYFGSASLQLHCTATFNYNINITPITSLKSQPPEKSMWSVWSSPAVSWSAVQVIFNAATKKLLKWQHKCETADTNKHLEHGISFACERPTHLHICIATRIFTVTSQMQKKLPCSLTTSIS